MNEVSSVSAKQCVILSQRYSTGIQVNDVREDGQDTSLKSQARNKK